MKNKYLTNTKNLANHIFWFYEEFDLEPRKEHIGLSINYSDIKERRTDFLLELINTVVSWVYNKKKIEELVNDRVKDGDYGNAYSFITNLAYSKFRRGHPQGQFGELLLFNLIQHCFNAAPLLRKQRITTSTGHERFGADAIHYKKENGQDVFVLGESKCYKKEYRFNAAFEASLSSIVGTFENLDDELILYVYDDFIEPDLLKIAKKYKEGELNNPRFELVCLIAYNETSKIIGEDEDVIKENIKKVIRNKCIGFNKKKFGIVKENLLKRINYIIFPIWRLDELLDNFQNKVGSNER